MVKEVQKEANKQTKLIPEGARETGEPNSLKVKRSSQQDK